MCRVQKMYVLPIILYQFSLDEISTVLIDMYREDVELSLLFCFGICYTVIVIQREERV